MTEPDWEIWTNGTLLSSLLSECSTSSYDSCGYLFGKDRTIRSSTVTDHQENVEKQRRVTTSNSFQPADAQRLSSLRNPLFHLSENVTGFYVARRKATTPSLQELSVLRQASSVTTKHLFLLFITPNDVVYKDSASESLCWKFWCYFWKEGKVAKTSLRIRSFQSTSEAGYAEWHQAGFDVSETSAVATAQAGLSNCESTIEALKNGLQELHQSCIPLLDSSPAVP
uniref:Uncharacterized protein n=1 Tax=Palpitomonas bilix TaxID=652834 RepID=A0A7S3D5Z7_9EUKA|mmetsp:Transcript_22769/g.57986  ORF Transcript_22769/g.57986 Transcript_22769/m.57986 type:complete len:226 (+) Transcript_22769:117-794(+)